MTMGDRVAVLNNGRLQQYAPPQELYDDPVTSSSPASSAARI